MQNDTLHARCIYDSANDSTLVKHTRAWQHLQPYAHIWQTSNTVRHKYRKDILECRARNDAHQSVKQTRKKYDTQNDTAKTVPSHLRMLSWAMLAIHFTPSHSTNAFINEHAKEQNTFTFSRSRHAMNSNDTQRISMKKANQSKSNE